MMNQYLAFGALALVNMAHVGYVIGLSRNKAISIAVVGILLGTVSFILTV